MSTGYEVYNTLEKLSPPPFVTTLVTSPERQRTVFKSWSSLKKKCLVVDQGAVLESELTLLTGFIKRKGTQLRLEKALMLSNRIAKLGRRWGGNGWASEFKLFDDGVHLSLSKKTSKEVVGRRNKKDDEDQVQVRLPSRQWSNWIIYLTLRDCLILAKIKSECERTVKFWLGLISSSHHATDSLVAVGILSRVWYVSSCMVEDLINVMYPMVADLTIHLEPTRAENWLTDLEIPSSSSQGELKSWLEAILGFPWVPASLSKGLETLSQGVLAPPKMDVVLQSFSKSITISSKGGSPGFGSGPSAKAKSDKKIPSTSKSTSSLSSLATKLQGSDDDEEEDLGVPVDLVSPPACPNPSTSTRKRKVKEKKNAKPIELNERWTLFFKGHKTKLKLEKGKKQFCVRIRNYLQGESDKNVISRLKMLRGCIKSSPYKEIILMINRFQKFLSKQ